MDKGIDGVLIKNFLVGKIQKYYKFKINFSEQFVRNFWCEFAHGETIWRIAGTSQIRTIRFSGILNSFY